MAQVSNYQPQVGNKILHTEKFELCIELKIVYKFALNMNCYINRVYGQFVFDYTLGNNAWARAAILSMPIKILT